MFKIQNTRYCYQAFKMRIYLTIFLLGAATAMGKPLDPPVQSEIVRISLHGDGGPAAIAK